MNKNLNCWKPNVRWYLGGYFLRIFGNETQDIILQKLIKAQQSNTVSDG